MKKLLSELLVAFILVFILGGLAFGVYRVFFMYNNSMVPAFADEGLHVVIEDEVITGKGQPRVTDGRILLPLEMVKEHIDPDINWDEKLHKLTVTTKDRVIRMKTGSLEAFVNNKPVMLNIPAAEEEGTVLVPIEFLSEFYGIDIVNNTESNVIIIDFKNRIRQTAEPVMSGAVVRIGRSAKEPIIKKLDGAEGKDRELRVFEEYEKWYRVRTNDGAVGYIEKKFVAVKLTLAANTPRTDLQADLWKPAAGKISMAWDYAYNVKFNLDKKAGIEGLDVISPTWFQVVGKDGEIKNHADSKYVEWAHNNGYKVWALFSNSFGNPAATSEFLRNTDARDNAIRQLLAFTALYELDGINIDFEDINANDKNALTQFVRELVPLLHEQGLVVSIDVNLLPCYDRKALGEIVDYVVLMAYDQHWKGGGIAGSVAQLSWVDRTVQGYLKDVPASKLILGVPFYTRLWKETPENGKIKLTSQALSMESIEKVLKENKAQKVWDIESGQFYSEYVKDGATYKVWLEDEKSMNLRTSLVHKYELAGAAAWRLEFEVPDVWAVITRNLKAIESYGEWKLQNQDGQYAYAE